MEMIARIFFINNNNSNTFIIIRFSIMRTEISRAVSKPQFKTLGPIYTVRLCRMGQAYDRPTTRIVSCKSNLQLGYDT